MRSWRAIALDIMRGVDTDTGESVREAIDRCGCEPPAERSGSLREAIMDIQEAASPLLFPDMDKGEQEEWIKNTVKHGVKLGITLRAKSFPESAPEKVQNVFAATQDQAYEFTNTLLDAGFDSEGTPKIPKVFPYHDNFFGKLSLADWQRMNKENRSDIEKRVKRMEAGLAKIKEYEKAQDERKKEFKTPCSKVFERMVFNMKKRRGKELEDNTYREQDIYRSVEEWIGGVDSISDEILQDFNFIKKCVGEYPDYFSPSVSVAWRGIKLGSSGAIGFLPMAELLKSKRRFQIGKRTYIGAPSVYKATKEIQSWSAEPKIAADEFASGDNRFPTFKKKEVQDWIKRFNAGKMSKEDIKEELVGVYEMIMVETELGVVYSMKTDEDFVFSEWFANELADDILFGGAESEVTRITTKGKTAPAMVYVPETFVEAVRAYNEAVDTVAAALGSKMPKGIKKI